MKRALRSALTLSMVAVLAAGAAACGKKDKPAGGSAGASDCDKLGERTVAQSMEDTPPGMAAEQVKALRGLAEQAGRAIATHCKDDGWSAKAIECGLTSKQPQVDCDALITPDQKQKMTRAVQEIFEKGAAAMMPPPSTPPSPPSPAPTAPPTAPPPAAPPAPTPEAP